MQGEEGIELGFEEKERFREVGWAFQLSNSINKDIVSRFGCDEYSKIM